MVNVLVLDQAFSGSVYKPVVFSDFLSTSDNIQLLIITSIGALSESDKRNALGYIELKDPITNGALELHAIKFHKQFGIDLIYTKQEDLILRASYLRQLMGLSVGLLPHQAILYRDKEAMKQYVKGKGVVVPPFRRVYSPVDVISFAMETGFPVIIKPTLGSASGGIKLIKSEVEMNAYLESEFYDRIDEQGKMMDYSGDMIIEGFIPGKMYHINGYAKNGELVHIWPFEYLSTNLEFTRGVAYGNASIPTSDPRYSALVEVTAKLLHILPAPRDLFFHLEMFELDSKDDQGRPEFCLCEIAARRPGGSIALLIDLLEGNQQKFPEIEFRRSLGLELRHSLTPTQPVVGDLMVPRKLGTLISMPKSCPLDGIEFIPLAKEGSQYSGFDMNVLNTAARLVVSNGSSVSHVEDSLKQGLNWTLQAILYRDFSLDHQLQ